MPNEDHLEILKQGVPAWNDWRKNNPQVVPDLSGADLKHQYLRSVNLRETNLSQANLWKVDLGLADLTKANLSEADLTMAMLSTANFTEANLRRAKLTQANLNVCAFNNADLREADLIGASLIESSLKGANISECLVYGISVWNTDLYGSNQKNLNISPLNEPVITVDNLEVAQFIYLLVHNEKLRHVIDTITSKVVLILGRFTPKRKVILDAIRDNLREANYLPVLFDFEKPMSRDFTETISTLAHMARFIIADITDAKSIPQELQRIVPELPSVPVQPLILASDHEYGMFEHFKRYPWVLKMYEYKNAEELLSGLRERFKSGRVRLENDQIQPNLLDRSQVYRMATDFGVLSNFPNGPSTQMGKMAGDQCDSVRQSYRMPVADVAR
jgi:hypothetical protein